jgi:type III secretion protein S
MSEEQFIYFTSQAMLLILYLSLPVVITTTVIGLLVGLFQALTQIQDQSLAFGLKLVAVMIVLLVTGGWVTQELLNYIEQLYAIIPQVHA